MLSASALMKGTTGHPALFERFADAEGRRAATAARAWSRTCIPQASFANKPKTIVAPSRLAVEHHGGRCRPRMDALVRLLVFGPENANVVVAHAFGTTAASCRPCAAA